jgi:hypothetical protein
MNEAPTQHRRTGRAAAITAAAIGLALAGCQRESVSHYRVPKSGPTGLGAMAADMSAAASAGMPADAPPPPMGGAMQGDVPPPPAVESGALRWTLPAGWTETKGGGAMRFATMKPPVAGKAEVTVIVLPGPAGGELANVNRWRNQIGLPPLGERELGAARKPLRAKGAPISVYDFASETPQRSRVVAGLTERSGNTWFVKLSGDAEAVSAARPAFMSLLESLRFDADAK